MNKVLIAVDDTNGTKGSFSICSRLCSCISPDEVILVYVEKFEGRSLIDEMLGDAEMSTLKEVLEGTEYKESLDKKANRVLDYYKQILETDGITAIRSEIKGGHPADEILRAAKESGADMIMLGSRGNRISHTFMGSVSREVVDRADIPVFIAKAR
ncbi:MAG: universal stress protein [Nitrospiraceae bacterium]|nr:MAG: universal stress protein [Nitrospiraceae bacterium]